MPTSSVARLVNNWRTNSHRSRSRTPVDFSRRPNRHHRRPSKSSSTHRHASSLRSRARTRGYSSTCTPGRRTTLSFWMARNGGQCGLANCSAGSWISVHDATADCHRFLTFCSIRTSEIMNENKCYFNSQFFFFFYLHRVRAYCSCVWHREERSRGLPSGRHVFDLSTWYDVGEKWAKWVTCMHLHWVILNRSRDRLLYCRIWYCLAYTFYVIFYLFFFCKRVFRCYYGPRNENEIKQIIRIIRIFMVNADDDRCRHTERARACRHLLSPDPPWLSFAPDHRDAVHNNYRAVASIYLHGRLNNIMFRLRLTQNNPELLDVTDPESLYASHFNPNHPVKIIIHGFQGGRNLSPSTDLRNGNFSHVILSRTNSSRPTRVQSLISRSERFFFSFFFFVRKTV